MTVMHQHSGPVDTLQLPLPHPAVDEVPDVDLSGLWVPIVTPFAADGSVDVGSLERLAARLLADGARGLVALGTTGEPATLDPEERRAVVETCDRVCRAAARPLLVGAGTNSTRTTIHEIEWLTAGVSAAGALVVVPYYTRPSEAAIVAHFHAVAGACPVPIVAYNVPYRTGRGLGADALADVAAHPRIVGLKQAVGAIDHDTLDLIDRTRGRLQVLAGDDAFIAPTMLMGGVGAIAAAAHSATSLFAELVERAIAGDVERSRELAAALLPVVTTGFAEPNPAVWKGALATLGEIATRDLRSPMAAASRGAVERHLEAVDGAWRRARRLAGTVTPPA